MEEGSSAPTHQRELVAWAPGDTPTPTACIGRGDAGKQEIELEDRTLEARGCGAVADDEGRPDVCWAGEGGQDFNTTEAPEGLFYLSLLPPPEAHHG